jgi:pSer/pThr/pTyr-binding forkhead associated (FHA) protein
MTTAPDEPVVLTIGRAQDCDLVVAHRSVSAHHAELRQAGSQYRIVDLSTKSGTFVNGVRSASQILDEGDTVHVGPVALEFRNGRLEIGIQQQPNQNEPTIIDVPPTSKKTAPTARTLAGIGLGIAGLVALLIVTDSPNRSGNGDEGRPAAFATTTTPETTTTSRTTAVTTTTTTQPAAFATTTTPETTTTSRTTAVTTTTTTQPAGLAPTFPRQSEVGEPDWELLARSIVDVWSPDCEQGGSGTIVLDGSYVLTNAHVAIDQDGTGKQCDLIVGFTDKSTEPPDNYVPAETILFDNDLDLAVLRLIDRISGMPIVAEGRAPIVVQQLELKLGEEISSLGYPAIGGWPITYSKGSASGTINLQGDHDIHGEFIKTTDLEINHGDSGGAIFNSTGQFVGVPTARISAEVVCEDELCSTTSSSVGLIRPSSYAESFLARLP